MSNQIKQKKMFVAYTAFPIRLLRCSSLTNIPQKQIKRWGLDQNKEFFFGF